MNNELLPVIKLIYEYLKEEVDEVKYFFDSEKLDKIRLEIKRITDEIEGEE